jgi:hypothetical protein
MKFARLTDVEGAGHSTAFMTARRHADDCFDAPLPSVASAVRTILVRRPPYTQATEIEKDTLFKTNVRPSWWLLGTEMTIRLQASSVGTKVITETKSQWFIFGDVFNYYNRYIRNFLKDLQTEIQKQRE